MLRHDWLAHERAVGRLPEHPLELPDRVPGGRKGLPSSGASAFGRNRDARKAKVDAAIDRESLTRLA